MDQAAQVIASAGGAFRIVLACGEGPTNRDVATKVGCSAPTVTKWRSRFVEQVSCLLWHGERTVSCPPRSSWRRSTVTSGRSVSWPPTSATPSTRCRCGESILAKSVRLFVQLPAVVAYDQRRRRGQELIPACEDLGYAENFLYTTFGEVPDAVVIDAFRVSLVPHAEHSFTPRHSPPG